MSNSLQCNIPSINLSIPEGYSSFDIQFDFENISTNQITGIIADIVQNDSSGDIYFEIKEALSNTVLEPTESTTLIITIFGGLTEDDNEYVNTLVIGNDIDGTPLEIELSVKVNSLASTVFINPTEMFFNSVSEGYSDLEEQVFVITNITTYGNIITGLSALIDTVNFEIVENLSDTVLNPNGMLSITVRPFAGLISNAAPYTGNLIITGDNGVELTAEMSITVSPVSTYELNITPTEKVFTSAEENYLSITPQQFTITNTGNQTITGLTIDFMNNLCFEVTSSLSSVDIMPGETSTFAVKPKNGLSVDTYTDTLVINNDNGITTYVDVEFTVESELTYIAFISINNYEFNTVIESYTSQQEQEFILTNGGTAQLSNISASLNNVNFEIASAFPTTIQPGDTASIKIKPSLGLMGNITPYNGVLTITGDTGISITVSLSIVVNIQQNYSANINITNHIFPSVSEGYLLQPEQLYGITNTGNQVITNLLAMLFDGFAFEISTSLSKSILPVGDTAIVGIRPKVALSSNPTPYTDKLEIIGDNGIYLSSNISFQVQDIPLSYSGVLNITTHIFPAATEGYGAQAAQQFIITNVGTGIISGLTASLGNSNFEIVTPLSSTSISPDDLVSIIIRPVIGLVKSVLPYTDTLTITGNNGISLSAFLSFTVNELLTYSATINPTIKVFTPEIEGYGVQAAQTFIINNTGTGPITSLVVSFGTADFEVSTPLSATTITGGSAATVSVRPKLGLPGSGTPYETIMTITGSSGISLSVALSFKVDEMFVPVGDIPTVPTDTIAGLSIMLPDNALPVNATNKKILWSIVDDGGTDSKIVGTMLTATNSGKVKIRATVVNGI